MNLSANFFVRRMRRKKEIKEEASEDCIKGKGWRRIESSSTARHKGPDRLDVLCLNELMMQIMLLHRRISQKEKDEEEIIEGGRRMRTASSSSSLSSPSSSSSPPFSSSSSLSPSPATG